MSALRLVARDSVITGWDFSTGGVKCLAFDVHGQTLAEVRLPTDLWTEGGVSELNLLQLEGQARASVRAMAHKLRDLGRLEHWAAGGISATHHTSGRIDQDRVQVRRAICWNDQSLMPYQERGLKRLGGQKKVRDLIGGPWAIRYALSHLVKDEETLSAADWERTWRILPHGSLAAGFLTGNFDQVSISAAASTGLMDLRSGQWCRDMLGALENPAYRDLAWQQLPRIVDQHEPIGPLSANLAMEEGIVRSGGFTYESIAGMLKSGDFSYKSVAELTRVPECLSQLPVIFPTSDDQQAGLVGGGAVDAGQLAIILGNSAVVNSSSDRLPATDNLDTMRLNWGPYLWMRCYTNGAQFLDRIVGKQPDWQKLEEQAAAVPPGVGGTMVLPFLYPEPSLGVMEKRFGWQPAPPRKPGEKFRAALEAIAYLIALGVRQHEQAGQVIGRVSVSGGIARSRLMCEILASVIRQPLHLLQSEEGPALGAAVTALAGLETQLRRKNGDGEPFTVADAVAQMVKFRAVVEPNPAWTSIYEKGLKQFRHCLATDGTRIKHG